MEGNILQFPSLPIQEGKKKTLYIVVDTNVFLSNLDAIVKVMTTRFAKYDKPILVIPWTVIRVSIKNVYKLFFNFLYLEK